MSQPRGRRKRPGALRPPVRSIRPFKSSEQYLEAMKEDLAEWFRDLYGLNIDAANFLQVLETGLVLCQHANTITEAALAFLAEAPAQAQRIPMPRAGVSYNGAAKPGTFQARDNVSNFIQWCRKEMGIQEVLMFETEDLVLRKNVKNVVLCLLEVGRRAWRFGMVAPTLVQLEQEIEEELRRELALPPPDPPPPVPPRRRACHFHNLDQMVQSLVSHCTCPVQFSMVKVSEGKYRVGDSNTLIFIRILRNHVMVRVGGGWDTLGHYLDKHDPCRCTSLSHKPSSFSKCPASPVQHEVRVQDGPFLQQPTMIISRSQSPLPPVDWKTYTGSVQRLRPPSSSSPRPHSKRAAGTGVFRETTSSQRSQERPLTPSQRQLSAGNSPLSLQSSTTHRDQDPQCFSSGRKEDSFLQELSTGRTPTSSAPEEKAKWGSHSKVPTHQTLQAPEDTIKGTSARGPSPLSHSSSSAKPQGLALPPRGEAEGASLQLREPASVHSASSSIKALTKIPIRLPPSRPPTPGSFSGTISGGFMAELGRGLISLRAITGNLAGSRHASNSVEVRQENQQAGTQLATEAGEPQGLGPQEQERRYAPLPSGNAKEEAIYHSPEEEIVASMKLLEVEGAGPQGTRPLVIPRSGVYVPSLGGPWTEPGSAYDQVIQELVQGPPALLKVDVGAWKAAPAESPKPAVTALGGKLGVGECEPQAKASGMAKGTRTRKVSPPGRLACSAPVSASPKDPPSAPLGSSSNKVKASLGKGKRVLRKPRRIPSIYKLKLRPRVRPRRDHRPEKGPSRIPKPLPCLCLGPTRAPPGEKVLRAALGRKGGEASQMGVASLGEEEAMKKKEAAGPWEGTPQPPESEGPRQLPPEEESWV
ncbi:GAS2-like protein 2 [Ctenodactylus gundi]